MKKGNLEKQNNPADTLCRLEAGVSDDFVREVESKFNKMMLGLNYTDNAEYLTMPFLRKSYDYACHLKLDQITALKYVCTQLQTVIDERLNKEMQAQNSR